MNKTSLIILALIITTLLFAGCRSNPVRNVSDAPVSASNSIAADQVRDAIIRAGSSLGWSMKADSPGHILATLYIRDHIAIADIHYDANKYSITYNDSTNLNYKDGNIHKNYNGWIQNLDNGIKRQLSML
ncbi:MAG: hypothetical protein LC646_04225 [Xanthomonadaceae bacterium]|nr:hypothetical protein [Xanthomonadaceae bacterium]